MKAKFYTVENLLTELLGCGYVDLEMLYQIDFDIIDFKNEIEELECITGLNIL